MSRHIRFERLHNFRDLGGYPTQDGRYAVRWGRLYRSDSLGKLAGEDWERFLELGVAAVIDLRYPWEIEAKGRVPEHPSLAYHNLSIEHRTYDQPSQGPDVAPGPFLAGKYMEVAEDGVAELRQALDVIAGTDGPVVFHCASGKDRTGQLAALVLTLLDVPEDVVVDDYALTRLATSRLLADWIADNGGREPTWPAYCDAPADVMRLHLAAMRDTYGSVAAYARTRLGVGPDLLAALRAWLLEPARAARAGAGPVADRTMAAGAQPA